MMFVENVHYASKWYADLLSVERNFIDIDIPIIDLGEIEIWFHKSDEKASSGTAGTVAYWQIVIH